MNLNVQNKFGARILDNSWIPATATYNYMMKDPCLDWFRRHHDSFCKKDKNYRDIAKKCLQDSRSEYSFVNYIMEQGVIFEKKVIKLLYKRFGPERLANIGGDKDPRDTQKVQATLAAMQNGVPFIYHGVVLHDETKTFGVPDLLVRSDWMRHLVADNTLSKEESHVSAPVLNKPWHYRVVDVKFSGLALRANGVHLLNSGSFPAYKSQLLIYNWGLGQLQGYLPNQAYILGRRWKYTSCGETYVNNSCFDRLGIIDYSKVDIDYINKTKEAILWLQEVNKETAADWNITEYPLPRKELYPNMCNTHDYPWHNLKSEIADRSKELTNLWMVGVKNREEAMKAGVYQWTDPKCTPELLGINGPKTSKILSEIININRDSSDLIRPKIITNNIGNWKTIDTVEFFVDFETCNSVISSIKKLPQAKTDTIIFMIGVGYIHPKTKKWIYHHFTVNRLTFAEEKRICQEFTDFIRHTIAKYDIEAPRCIHWSQAEDTMWNEAMDRHLDVAEEWSWEWLDLLKVFKEEPIVIKGCLSYGLKDVAAAMKKHGFIKSSWNKEADCVDGQSAMIAARKAHLQARAANTSMLKIPVMKDIISYNEIDVKVMQEILSYLRMNHVHDISRHPETLSDVTRQTNKRKR